jgi:hypothetical protein
MWFWKVADSIGVMPMSALAFGEICREIWEHLPFYGITFIIHEYSKL